MVAFAIVAALAATAPVFAQDITIERWVDKTNGDDGNNCTRSVEEGDPDTYTYHSCETIQRALAVANPGDVIRVAAGTYAGPLTINKELTFIGGYAPGFGSFIDPPTYPAYYPTVSGGSPPIQITAGTSVTLTTISLDGFKVSGGVGGGIRVQWVGLAVGSDVWRTSRSCTTARRLWRRRRMSTGPTPN